MNTDEEVQKILKTMREFWDEPNLTEEQARAIDAASERPPVKIKCRKLLSWKDRNKSE